MVNILIIGEDEKFFIEAISDIPNITVHEIDSYKKALPYCIDNEIELVIFDLSVISEEILTAITDINESDEEIMIVTIVDMGEDSFSDEFIVSGAQDVILKPVNKKTFVRKVTNYINIISYRSKRLLDLDSKNIFTNEVYSRSVVFRTSTTEGLVEMWDYLLNHQKNEVTGFSQCVKVFYAFAEFQIKRDKKTRVILEESHDDVYLTIEGVEDIPNKIINNVIHRNYLNGTYKISVNKISFKLPKVVDETVKEKDNRCLKLEDDAKQVLRAHFKVKISAKDYVDSTPINFIDSLENLEEVEDRIDINILDYEEKKDISLLNEGLSSLFMEYFEIIENLAEFSHLAFAIEKLANFLKALDDSKLDDLKRKKLVVFLSTILEDLTQWRKTIFIDQSTEDIHYLDSSILNSLLQVEIAVEDIAEEDDELELF